MADYVIDQGSTFQARIMWMQPDLTVKSISGLTKSAAPVATVATHAIPDGVDWPVWIRGVLGMTKINHDADAVGDHSESYDATPIDANSLTLSVDTLDFAAYTSGGELIYQPPVDLTGCIARMHIRRRIGDDDPVLTLLSSGAAPDSRLTILSPATVGVIDIEISATDTAAISWSSAVWDVEVETSAGAVTRIASGKFTVSKEVTR